MRHLMILPLLTLAALLASSEASACASCANGDPTLTAAIGEEIPTGNRVRAGLMSRYWSRAAVSHGNDHDHSLLLREVQLNLLASYAPTDRLVFALNAPVHARELSGGHGAPWRTLALGDVELAARWVMFRDREFSPNHLVSLLAGVELPTSPIHLDDSGTTLDPDYQTGSGSFDPRIGAGYSFFSFPWSVQVSSSLRLPTRGTAGLRQGEQVELRAGAQRQFGFGLGARLTAEARYEGEEFVRGVPAEGSGGAIAYAAPSLLYSPVRELVLEATAHLPVYAHGSPEAELPTYTLTAMYAF
jgi:hypothetical protein